MAAIAAVSGCLILGVSGAWAAQVNLCVPSAAGQAITSNGSGTSCGSGKTAVALPSSSADQQTLISILPHLSVVSSGIGAKPTIRFSGVNVQVVSGSGSTSTVNGEGNLVLGYDESPGSQTGSDNLVLGAHQAYTSYGSVLGGTNNTDSGNSSVMFGSNNTASGSYSSVTGGRAATASGSYASVQGGFHNQVSAGYGSIAGGCNNLAGSGTPPGTPTFCATDGDFAEIAGGESNQASASNSSVSGGQFDHAADPFSSISGGCLNVAGSGARLTSSCAGYPFIRGTGNPTVSADTGSETVSGGYANTATQFAASVTGGEFNSVDGPFSSVTGGGNNTASSDASTVTGGEGNSAVAEDASVTGGQLNTAATVLSSVTGGYNNRASGELSSVAGGEFNLAGDSFSFIGAGCDNLTGTGTNNTQTCDPGSEAILGGASHQLTATDSTYPAGP